MPTSATGSQPLRRSETSLMAGTNASGFSLIELLVALVIVVLLTTTATLSLGLRGSDGASVLRQEANRLLGQLEAAQQEAVLTNQHLGLQLLPQGAAAPMRLQWLKFRNHQWIDAGDLLPALELPPRVQLELVVDGIPVTLPPADTAVVPQLLLEPDGTLPAFSMSMRLGGSDSLLRIGTDARGRLGGLDEVVR